MKLMGFFFLVWKRDAMLSTKHGKRHTEVLRAWYGEKHKFRASYGKIKLSFGEIAGGRRQQGSLSVDYIQVVGFEIAGFEPSIDLLTQ